MYCGNCGQVNVDGAERCARCGAPLIGPRPQSQPAPRQTYPPQRPAQPTPQPPKSYAQTSQPPQPYAQTPQTQSTAWVPVQLSGSQNGWQQHGVAPAQQPPIQPMPGPVAPSAEGRPRPFLVAGLIALAGRNLHAVAHLVSHQRLCHRLGDAEDIKLLPLFFQKIPRERAVVCKMNVLALQALALQGEGGLIQKGRGAAQKAPGVRLRAEQDDRSLSQYINRVLKRAVRESEQEE